MKIFVDKCQMSPIQMERLCFNCRVFINALGAFNKEGTPSSPNIKYCEFDCSFMSKLENPNFRPPLGARRQVLTHCVRNQSSGGQRRGWGEERIYPAHHPTIGQQMLHIFGLFLMHSLCDAAAAVHNIFPNFENLFCQVDIFVGSRVQQQLLCNLIL